MYEMPRIGVAFGTVWLVHEILREHLTATNTLDAFEQSVAESYLETVKIGWIEHDTASAIKELDQIFGDVVHGEWFDSEIWDGNIITIENGSSHYLVSEIEQLIEEFVPESVSAPS